MKKKLILEDLKIESFLTSSHEELTQTEKFLGGVVSPTSTDSYYTDCDTTHACPSSPTSASDYDCP